MKSYSRKTLKKVWRIIIITLVVYICMSFAITKLVYDSCFPRYEGQKEYAEELSDVISIRQSISRQPMTTRLPWQNFVSGFDNMLQVCCICTTIWI